MVKKRLIITIDGPAGSGKSTTARQVAEKLGYDYLDSGALYRAVTLACLQQKVDLQDSSAVTGVAKACDIHLSRDSRGTRVWLNGEDVSEAIRTPQVTLHIGPIAANADLRKVLLKQQRMMAAQGGMVAEGRDMGTVVFPHADLKFFMVAGIEERARRRQAELVGLGHRQDLDTLERTIRKRDEEDSNRDSSPLRKPEGAEEIDTTQLTIEQQVERIVAAAVQAGAVVP